MKVKTVIEAYGFARDLKEENENIRGYCFITTKSGRRYYGGITNCELSVADDGYVFITSNEHCIFIDVEDIEAIDILDKEI